MTVREIIGSIVTGLIVGLANAGNILYIIVIVWICIICLYILHYDIKNIKGGIGGGPVMVPLVFGFFNYSL